MKPSFADILFHKLQKTQQIRVQLSLKRTISLKRTNSLKLLALSALMTLSPGAIVSAQDQTLSSGEDSFIQRQLQYRSLPVNQKVLSLYQNPGDMRYQDSLSLSGAYAGITRNSSDQAIYPQDGTALSSINIGAKSFLHLDPKQSVWGNAQFSTGSYKDIKWSNCIDYQKIAPYVLGDEVGGDLSFRQYKFGGGYSYLLDNGLIIGAKLEYRAEIAWRDRDPRVRTIVSDLDFTLGASYKYNTNGFVGVSASVESYTQNCDLEFYNPLNQINTLPLTGLGSYNKRFAGNTNKNSGHSGFGYHLGCHLGSINHDGLQLDLWFKGMRMNQLLRNFNNITFAFTDTYITHATVGYPLSLSHTLRIMPVLEGEYFHRLGTENLFGTASGASYDKIGSRSPYLNEHVNVSFMIPVEFNLSGSSTRGSSSSATYLTLEPSASYHSLTEELTSLGRKIEVTTISPEINLSLNGLSGKWLYDIRALYGWTNCLTDKWTFPGYDNSIPLQESVASTFMMLSSSNSILGGEVTISRKIGKMVVGLSVAYSHRNYSTSNSSINSSSSSSSSSSSQVETGIQKARYRSDNLDISLKINF